MLPKCLLCQSTESKLVESGIRQDPAGKVWKCKQCGLVYLWPQPTEEELESYYSGTYRGDYGSGSVKQRHEWDRREARQRIEQLRIPARCNVLEIGSGSGAFLRYLYYGIGIEPDENSRRWINRNFGFSLYKSIADLPEGSKFDMIVMFHVLEHLLDPVAFLRELRKYLSPGGKVVIEVPNVKDIMLWIPAYRKRYFFQRAHLYYFSKRTLKQVAEKAGFAVTHTDVQRYNFSSHVRWAISGRNRGDGYFRDLRKSLLGRIYARLLIGIGRSDTLWAELEVCDEG